MKAEPREPPREPSAPAAASRAHAVGSDEFAYRTSRVQASLLIVALGILFYVIQYSFLDRPRLLLVNCCAALALLVCRAAARRLAGGPFEHVPIHAAIAAAAGAVLGGALLAGQGRSLVQYYLVLVPAFAACLLPMRATLVWTGITILGFASIQGSDSWVTIEPEFVGNPIEDFVGRSILAILVCASAIAQWKTTARYVAGVKAGEATILEQTRQLEVARDEALQASRVKSEFLATMSHEIRTPMNAVIGFTSLVLGTALDDEQRRMLESVRRSGDSLLAILNEILDFSKIESGRMELECRPFSLRGCVEESMEQVAPRAAEQGVALQCRYEAPAPDWISGDATRLRQVVVNLLSNAVKFTTDGEVVISVCAPRGPTASGCLLRIAVRDTGIGIPMERRDRLFQPFRQIDSSTTRRYGGTGLGLAISKRLVDLMGGAMSVESEVGCGSTFSFSFFAPLAEEKDEQDDDRTTVIGTSVAGPVHAGAMLPRLADRLPLRILLAEDNLVNQRVAQAMLGRLGYATEVATNGREAVEALARDRFDVVLMDMQMPEMDGLEATRAIRAAAGANARVCIVALTANAFEEDRRRCLAAGMDDFLAKPLALHDLAAALERAAPVS